VPFYLPPPRTIGEFIDAWENGGPRIVYNPLRIDSRFDGKLALPPICGVSGGEAEASPIPAANANLFFYVIYDQLTGAPNLLGGYLDGSPLGGPTVKACPIEIPIPYFNDVNFRLRVALRQTAKAEWSAGPFAEAFPSLSNMTQYLKSLTPPDLVHYLQVEKDKAEDKVEIFGAKIPFELVSSLGSIIVLAAQFYLWCHLVEFTNRIQNGLKDDFIGYFGFYDDQPAVKVFTILTAVCAPVAVLAFASITARKTHYIWITPAVSSVCSGYLGWLLVRSFARLWCVKNEIATEVRDADVRT
jgi:hypothetical protein